MPLKQYNFEIQLNLKHKTQDSLNFIEFFDFVF